MLRSEPPQERDEMTSVMRIVESSRVVIDASSAMAVAAFMPGEQAFLALPEGIPAGAAELCLLGEVVEHRRDEGRVAPGERADREGLLGIGMHLLRKHAARQGMVDDPFD